MKQREEIIDLVKNLTDSNANIEIQIGGDTFSTRMLHYDSSQEYFYIDQLIPKSGNDLLERNHSYFIKHRYYDSGIMQMINFNAVYLDATNYKRLPASIFKFPSEAYRKSTALNVTPRPHDNLVLEFDHQNRRHTEQVNALNVRSMSFKSSDSYDILPEGVIIYNTVLRLPKGEVVFDAKLKHTAKYLYEMEYLELSYEVFGTLNQYIQERYRESYGFAPSAEKLVRREQPQIVYKPKVEFPKFRGKIFIVDDETLITEMLSGILNRNGFLCHVFNEGSQIVEKAASLKPDAILLDVKMPEYDGFTLCRRLKRDGRTSHIPIIMLTSASTQDDVMEAKESGANLYIVKSAHMQIEDIIKRLESLINK
ncbi:flagellar brake protein [bacterium]|nr:flagellar brake protein [bacterium]